MEASLEGLLVLGVNGVRFMASGGWVGGSDVVYNIVQYTIDTTRH